MADMSPSSVPITSSEHEPNRATRTATGRAAWLRRLRGPCLSGSLCRASLRRGSHYGTRWERCGRLSSHAQAWLRSGNNRAQRQVSNSATSWTTPQDARLPRSSRPSRAPMHRRLLLAELAPLVHARTAQHAKEVCCRPRQQRPRAPLQQAEAQQAPRSHHRLPISAAFAHTRRASRLAIRLSLASLQRRVHSPPWCTQASYPAHPTQLHVSSR